MRFGHFFYPMKFDDSRDDQEIQECLDEAVLVEALGFDAIWIAEHYFTGECVYGDPLVFASAVAVKTSRVLLGFGIIELPLHNPVRVAMQTALLDNLSRGRLVVGTAKGSNYNAFEYTGFGTDPALGAAQMEEAEKLMVTAWTTDNVDFRGEHYQMAFPSVRPRPYQKPHPPLARACINREAIIEMARIGRPILLRGRSTNSTAADIALYRDTMAEAGFDEANHRTQPGPNLGVARDAPGRDRRPGHGRIPARQPPSLVNNAGLPAAVEPQRVPHVPATAARPAGGLRRASRPGRRRKPGGQSPPGCRADSSRCATPAFATSCSPTGAWCPARPPTAP